KRYASKVITIVCIGIIIYAAYGLIDICKDYYQNQQVTNDVRETFHEAASAEKKERDKEINTHQTVACVRNLLNYLTKIQTLSAGLRLTILISTILSCNHKITPIT